MNLFAKLHRIAVIAGHAFTQLVRMKVFYFLIVFALILLASNLIELPQHIGPETSNTLALQSIRSWSVGTMTLFSSVFGVCAIALLLPKDAEDRTLYTILSKPVPRFDYLAGRLLGVLILIGVSLALMDALMCGVLHLRAGQVAAEEVAWVQHQGGDAAAQAAASREVFAHGVTWGLQGAVVVAFLQATVITAFALMIASFSTSTLFSTIVALAVYFLGHFQADARDYYLQSGLGTTWAAKFGAAAFTLVLPDFGMFNVIDALVEGKAVAPDSLAQLAGVSIFYALTYLMAARVVFARKEF